jgi:hypothetical protein
VAGSIASIAIGGAFTKRLTAGRLGEKAPAIVCAVGALLSVPCVAG